MAANITTNQRTQGVSVVPAVDLEQRIFQILNHLGDWIGAPKSEKVGAEFADWGGRRFGQGIPLSELVTRWSSSSGTCTGPLRTTGWSTRHFQLLKPSMSCRCTCAVCGAQPRVTAFFDEALYALTIGYEKRRLKPSEASARAHFRSSYV